MHDVDVCGSGLCSVDVGSEEDFDSRLIMDGKVYNK
jgi:hypothetical protein